MGILAYVLIGIGSALLVRIPPHGRSMSIWSTLIIGAAAGLVGGIVGGGLFAKEGGQFTDPQLGGLLLAQAFAAVALYGFVYRNRPVGV